MSECRDHQHVFQIQVLCSLSIIVIHMLLAIVHRHSDVEKHDQDQVVAMKHQIQ